MTIVCITTFYTMKIYLYRYFPFLVKVNGGREGRPIGAYELAKAVEELGAGEILLNCIDCDGMTADTYNSLILLSIAPVPYLFFFSLFCL